MSMVVVLAATTYDEPGSVWILAAQTAMGAAIGAAVVLLLPVSRVADRRRALSAPARRLAEVWSLVGAGLAGGWSADERDPLAALGARRDRRWRGDVRPPPRP